MTAHTPLPWRLGSTKKDGMAFSREIETSLMGHCTVGHTVAPSSSEAMIERAEANAAFIVRACNSHYELLEALKQVMGWIGNWHPNFADDEEWLTVAAPQIKAAIGKAEGTANG